MSNDKKAWRLVSKDPQSKRRRARRKASTFAFSSKTGTKNARSKAMEESVSNIRKDFQAMIKKDIHPSHKDRIIKRLKKAKEKAGKE
jgi:hypothetical protein